MDVETHLFKILVVGDSGVGKTSLIRRYTTGCFTDGYKATIGVEFSSKVIKWENGDKPVEFILQFWDLAGQERFGTQIKAYFRETSGAICVYDITQETAPDGVLKWKKLVQDNSPESDMEVVPCTMFVNKIDLVDNIQQDEIDKAAKKVGFISGFGVSALNGNSVDDAMKSFLMYLYNKRKRDIASGLYDDEEDKEIVEVFNYNDSTKFKPRQGSCYYC